MRYIRHLSLIIPAMLISLLAATAATASAGDDSNDYNLRQRVARVTFLSGDVQLRRAGSREWESAAVNLPLVEGDQLATGKNSSLEIQIDAYNFVRLDEDSVLSIVTLRDEGAALSLAEGTLSLRLARFDRDREYFEVDAPKTTMAAEKRGLYRVDAGRKNGYETSDVRITVHDGGRARLYSETSGFTLRDGRTARLFFDGGDEGGDWELSSAPQLDAWDRWVDERENYLAERLKYERRDRYYDNGVWGAEELDAYGDWVNAGDYGYIWRPHTTVTNNYNNWAPYRHGYWRWCPPYGYTWIPLEPWGWAPYHYGRWIYYNGFWCWWPRNYYNYGYSRWHPSLVVFTSYSNSYCWYPLPRNHPDPVYTGPSGPTAPVRPMRPPNKDQTVLVPEGKRPLGDEAYLNAVSSVLASDFGTPKPIAKPLTGKQAQLALDSKPVSIASVPVKKPVTDSVPSVVRGNDLSPGRPRGKGVEGTSLTERPTGAATRSPGKPLDEELRRTRLYNGREPVSRQDSDSSTIKSGSNTGAVTRPTRTVRPATDDRPVIRNSDDGNGTVVRPVRPSRPAPTTTAPPVRDDSNSSPDNDTQTVRPVPVPRPPARPEVSEPRPQRPSRQERDDSQTVRPEPQRPSRPEPERPSRSEPERSSPPPQPAPAPPPPRQEAPPQVAPPPSKPADEGGGGRKRDGR